MRDISDGTLAELIKAQGTEPINIIEIQWYKNANWYGYSDTEIYSDQLGKILELSNLENVLKISGSGSTTSISITLDDTTGQLKQIFDTNDIHKRPVRVYQNFNGLSYNDKFLIFEGQINSPIVWKEGTRTLSFEVISQIEDKEVGFSIEESSSSVIPIEAVGRPWPLAFGTTIDYPALTFQKSPIGTVKEGFFFWYAQQGNEGQEDFLNGAVDYTNGMMLFMQGVYCSLAAAILRMNARSALEKKNIFALAPAPTKIYAGEGSPLTYSRTTTGGSGGGSTSISFSDDGTGSSIRGSEGGSGATYETGNVLIDYEVPPPNISVNTNINTDPEALQAEAEAALSEADSLESQGQALQEQGNAMMAGALNAQGAALAEQQKQEQYLIDAEKAIPYKKLNGLKKHVEIECLGIDDFPTSCKVKINDTTFKAVFHSTNITARGGGGGTALFTKPDPIPKFEELVDAIADGLGYISIPSTKTEYKPIIVEPGSTITINDDFNMDYIVNIVPTTVIAVRAYRSVDGIRQLVSVPSNYYSVTTVNFGNIPITVVRLKRPLSSHMIVQKNKIKSPIKVHVSEGWEDQIYVTQISSIGPNTIDIIKHIVKTYSDLEIDEDSFEFARLCLNNYPSNFILTEKKNILTVLDEIAFQARCSLWIKEGKIYIKYLPHEEDPVDSINENDIIVNTLEVSSTTTEDIITKYTGTWRDTYEDDLPNKIITRFNITQYGSIEQEIDFYTYNQSPQVMKSLTFWMIRKANVWKILKFSTFLHKLRLETFDTVLLNFAGNYVADSPVKGIIQSAQYNSESQTIEFEIWVPVRLGEMSPYMFAWPQSVSIEEIFPTREDIYKGKVQTTLDNQTAKGTVATSIGQQTTGSINTDTQGWEDSTKSPNINFKPVRSITPTTPAGLTHSIIRTGSGGGNTPVSYGESLYGNSPISDRGDRYPSDIGDEVEDLNLPMQSNANTPEDIAFPEYSSQVKSKQRELGQGPPTTTSSDQPASREIYLGRVIAGSGDIYQVQLYPYGTNGAPGRVVTVSIPQIAPSEQIPTGTILSAIHKFKQGKSYYYQSQPPVWVRR